MRLHFAHTALFIERKVLVIILLYVYASLYAGVSAVHSGGWAYISLSAGEISCLLSARK